MNKRYILLLILFFLLAFPNISTGQTDLPLADNLPPGLPIFFCIFIICMNFR